MASARDALYLMYSMKKDYYIGFDGTMLLLSIILASVALADQIKPTLWQTTIALSPVTTDGNFGSFASADGICSTGQPGQWVAMYTDGVAGFGPQYNLLIDGKKDDYVIVRDVLGRDVLKHSELSQGSIKVRDLTQFTNYEAYLGALPDTNGRIRDDPRVWIGAGTTCTQWTTTSGTGGAALFSNPISITQEDCISQLRFLCVKQLEPVDTIPYVTNTSFVAITDSVYTGNLGGESGANAKCEAEAGEPGWTAILSYDLNDYAIQYTDGTRLTIQDYYTGAVFNYITSPSLFAYRLYRGYPLGYINQPIPSTFSGTTFGVGDDLGWVGASFYHCSGWTTTTGLGASLNVFASGPDTYNDYVTQSCANTRRLICISPPRTTTIYPDRYIISTSAESTNGNIGGFSGGDALCATPTNPELKAGLISSVGQNNIFNASMPVQMVNIYNETYGDLIEPWLVLLANWTFARAPFPLNDGVLPIDYTYWSGLDGGSCDTWTESSDLFTGRTVQSGNAIDLNTNSTCDTQHRLVCIGPLNSTEPVQNQTTTTPTPTPTPTSTSTTPTSTSTTPTPTSTSTMTSTPTPTSTQTTSTTPTSTATATTTETPSPSPTATTVSPVPTGTSTTVGPTSTPAPTPTPTPTPIPTDSTEAEIMSIFITYGVVGLAFLIFIVFFVILV